MSTLERPVDEIASLNLAARALRTGIQLLWGSQAGMVSALAKVVMRRIFPRDHKLMEAWTEILKYLLDYRLGDGRTAMLLAMGLDSMPGRLELELPGCDESGAELRAHPSRARATVLQCGSTMGGLETIPVIVTNKRGEFSQKDRIFIGGQQVGSFESISELCRDAGPTLYLLHYTPDKEVRAESASLRASLPAAVDTPERAVQERILRDIASSWGGELRTDPQWTLSKRRVTVHPQGGCSMGAGEEGVTDVFGNVRGCAGLYVMDAWTRESPMMDLAGAAYMVIHNNTDVDDALVGASSPVAEFVELHLSSMDDEGMMSMNQVMEIPVPAHADAVLKPGSYHLMLINLNEPLVEGTAVELSLEFMTAEPQTVSAPVMASMPMMSDMDDMDHGDMDMDDMAEEDMGDDMEMEEEDEG